MSSILLHVNLFQDIIVVYRGLCSLFVPFASKPCYDVEFQWFSAVARFMWCCAAARHIVILVVRLCAATRTSCWSVPSCIALPSSSSDCALRRRSSCCSVPSRTPLASSPSDSARRCTSSFGSSLSMFASSVQSCSSAGYCDIQPFGICIPSTTSSSSTLPATSTSASSTSTSCTSTCWPSTPSTSIHQQC